jgi:DNA-binding CsgD family transcriptional regulator
MNIDVEQWDGLIGDLYDAVLDPQRFQPALARADRMLESDLCHIVGLTNQGQENFRFFSHGDTESAGDLYASYYNRIDPRRFHMEKARVGATYRCAEFFDPSFVSGNEFYQDFLIPHGYRYVIGGCLHRSEDANVFVAFNHGAGRPDFTDQEHRFFERYITHLSRATQSIFAHAPVASALASESALHALEYGVMALDHGANIVYCNRAAEAMIAGDLRSQVSKGRLADSGELSTLFRRLLLEGRAHAVKLVPSPGAAPVFVSGVRTRSRGDTASPFGGYLARAEPAAVLIFSLGKNKAVASPSQLMQMFGLSPAEARLAYELGGGMSVNDYAERYSVSVATARTQLRAVLHKTGEARQQDLVRMLIALPRNAGDSPRG